MTTNDRAGVLERRLQEFAGNEDRTEERQQFLKSPFIARYVRIHPTNWHRHIGLRAGLLGCPYVGQLAY